MKMFIKQIKGFLRHDSSGENKMLSETRVMLGLTAVNALIVHKSVTKKDKTYSELLAIKLLELSASTRKPRSNLRRDHHSVIVERNARSKSIRRVTKIK